MYAWLVLTSSVRVLRASHLRHALSLYIPPLQVFVPKVAAPGSNGGPLWRSPLFRAGAILVTQTLGWPLYLCFNVGGRFYERCGKGGRGGLRHCELAALWCVCVCVCVRV